MRRSALDASAILAALFREPGADRVEECLEQGIVSAVNLTEIAAKLADRGLTARQAEDLQVPLNLTVHAFDELAALTAASLRTRTRSIGLSLGDRACLALGLTEGIPVVTTDCGWAGVADELDVDLILAR